MLEDGCLSVKIGGRGEISLCDGGSDAILAEGHHVKWIAVWLGYTDTDNLWERVESQASH